MDELGLTGVVPFRFACHRCARCCTGGSGYVWLADGEATAMACELSMSEASFVDRFVRRSGERLSLREASSGQRGGRCALLVGSNTCSVYAARPAQCRSFPYWPSVLADPAAFESARSTCPGIAVVVPEATRERAFARLEALYAEVDRAPRGERSLAEDGDVFVTGLEADFWTPDRTAGREPLAQRARGCSRSSVDRFLAELRVIERETGYPPSYGRLDDMLRARAHTECGP